MAGRFSLGWLKPPPISADGVMSLGDHLRELRYRVVFSLVFVVVAMIVSAIFYNQILAVMLQPWYQAQELLRVSSPNLDPQTVINGVSSPLTLALQIIAVTGLVLASPIWLYQLWAYIVPALLAKEKKYALVFIGTAVPLFCLGVAVGYFVLPQGISVMLAFTPTLGETTVVNLVDLQAFLELMLRLMIVFGLGFLMPVVVVGANLVGVVKASQLARARVYVIFGTFVFGAAATPSTDPVSMLALAVPMSLLYLGAEVVCRLNDRRKAKRALAEAAAG